MMRRTFITTIAGLLLLAPSRLAAQAGGATAGPPPAYPPGGVVTANVTYKTDPAFATIETFIDIRHDAGPMEYEARPTIFEDVDPSTPWRYWRFTTQRKAAIDGAGFVPEVLSLALDSPASANGVYTPLLANLGVQAKSPPAIFSTAAVTVKVFVPKGYAVSSGPTIWAGPAGIKISSGPNKVNSSDTAHPVFYQMNIVGALGKLPRGFALALTMKKQ